MASSGGAGGRRVTQRDVAREANVSTAIVSAVVNTKMDSIRVSEKTRARVRQAIRDLNYVPNVAAQNLAGGRSRIVGAFTYHDTFPRAESRDFYYEFLVGIEEEAEKVGHNLLLFTGARDESGQRSVFGRGANMLRLADGAILVGGKINADEIRRLTDEGYPFTVIGRHEVQGLEFAWVAANYADGTELVMDDLYARGHRRVLMVAGRRTHETLVERRSGFAAACTRHRLKSDDAPMVAFGEPNPDLPRVPHVDDEQGVLRFAAETGSTAIVAESSYVAHRVYHAALGSGMVVPRDVSIVGLGDHGDRENVLLPDPALTQLSTPRREIGAAAVRMLLRQLDGQGQSPEHEWIACEIVTGTTVGAPPASR
ncbi:LacI family DNA-binding transcriptional regulator [Ruania alba]|uniref:DNA-binding transcriptional regulator, LacI/PurR family n=1 Tax=Ruania alba TaxID=648782 RepID=A0A1H5N303_9MICO|nr:LacI family DNA-binding transcriptional regulator [Ruania alba]SEE95317.1 DNA-binding transcriptional regulator, LacI/PurR family [Ruania alba]